MIRHRIEMTVYLERYPRYCQECPLFYQTPFSKCLYETGRRLTPPVPMGKPMSARPDGGGWTCTSGGLWPSALRVFG